MRQTQDIGTQSVQELENLLLRSIESVHQTDESLLDMIESYLNMGTIDIQLNEDSRTNNPEVKKLELHFEEISELGLKAKLNVDEIEDFSKAIKKSRELSHAFDELNQTLSILIKKFYNDYEVFLEQLSKLKRSIFH